MGVRVADHLVSHFVGDFEWTNFDVAHEAYAAIFTQRDRLGQISAST